jgi:hypothetical protein
MDNVISSGNRSTVDRVLPDLTWRDPLKADDEPVPRRTKTAGVRRHRIAANMIQPTIEGPVRKTATDAKLPKPKLRPDANDKFAELVPALDSSANIDERNQGDRVEPLRHRSVRRTRRSFADRASPPSFRRGERWKRRLPKILW